MEVTIILKNGHLIQIKTINSADEFIQALVKSVDPKAANNIYVEGGLMLSFGDIAAVVPSKCVVTKQEAL